MEAGAPIRIFLVLMFGFILSFLVVGSSAALNLSMDRQTSKDSLEADQINYVLLGLTNSERHIYGLRPLKLNEKLMQSARGKCRDMVDRNYWAHTTPDGKNLTYFIDKAGIKDFYRVDENLAIGQSSPAQAHQALMISPPHRSAILDEAYTDVGFASCTYRYKQPGSGPINSYVEHFLAH